jgi:hypothetical protein
MMSALAMADVAKPNTTKIANFFIQYLLVIIEPLRTPPSRAECHCVREQHRTPALLLSYTAVRSLLKADCFSLFDAHLQGFHVA